MKRYFISHVQTDKFDCVNIPDDATIIHVSYQIPIHLDNAYYIVYYAIEESG